MAAAIPELHRKVRDLDHILQSGAGWFNRRLSHGYFRRWGAYTGLALEQDWSIQNAVFTT